MTFLKDFWRPMDFKMFCTNINISSVYICMYFICLRERERDSKCADLLSTCWQYHGCTGPKLGAIKASACMAGAQHLSRPCCLLVSGSAGSGARARKCARYCDVGRRLPAVRLLFCCLLCMYNVCMVIHTHSSHGYTSYGILSSSFGTNLVSLLYVFWSACSGR